MSEPIVFISRNRIKEGKSEEFRKHYGDSIPPILAGKTGTIAQLGYENEGANEFTVVRLFPSAEAFDQQIHGADERSAITYQYIEPIAVEIFGTPNQDTLEKMRKIAGKGVVVSFIPNYMGGFIR